MTDEKTRALIAEARERAEHPATGSNVAQCLRECADALSALTVPDGDTRERLLRLITEYMPGRDGIPKVQDAWLADAILAAFPVLSRAAAPEPEWEYGVQYIPPSAYAGDPVKCGSERAARLAVRGSSEPIRLLRRRPKVVHPAGPWESLPVGGETDGEEAE